MALLDAGRQGAIMRPAGPGQPLIEVFPAELGRAVVELFIPVSSRPK